MHEKSKQTGTEDLGRFLKSFSGWKQEIPRRRLKIFCGHARMVHGHREPWNRILAEHKHK